MSDDVSVEGVFSDGESSICKPGLRLQRARELRGLTQEQVSSELRLALRFVKAIEADTYKELPEPAFVRGYMRRYAQLVKLSPDDIAASFDQCYSADMETPSLDARAQNPIQLLGRLVRPRLPLRRLLPWLSLGLIVLLVAGFIWHSVNSRESFIEVGSSAETHSAIKTEVTLAQPVAMSGTSSTHSEAAADVATDASQITVGHPTLSSPTAPMTTLPTPVVQVGPVAPAPVTASAPVAAPATAVPVTVAPALAANGSDTLILSLSAESWLSVKDAKGTSLIAAQRPAGQTVTLKGQAPFYVNVGNAPGVTLTFNGKPVDLRPYTKGAVATLIVRP